LNNRIRRIVIATSHVTTLAGTGAATTVDGAGAQAAFSSPVGISFAANGMFAIIADTPIRRIELSSPPCSAGFYCPAGSSSPTQASCGPGQFCGVTGLSAPTLCAPGYYCANGAAFTVRGAMDGQGMDMDNKMYRYACLVS
jgi:hypothetical protein